MSTTVIVSGARTPMGKLLGSLREYAAAELGAHAIRGALDRAGIDPELIQHVAMGNVIQAGSGQNPARQAALASGLGMHVPAVTINNVCLSSMEAIAQADMRIRAGAAEIVIAGGMESMTRAPHLVPGGREGVKYGSWQMLDAIAQDALTCAIERESMGSATERYTAALGLSRDAQDAFSVRSHELAHAATVAGVFKDELAPMVIPQRKGEATVSGHDEGVRAETSMDSLARLRPAFADGGTITAGNASQISDGAAAVIVMAKERALALGIPWIAEIVATSAVAGPDPSLLLQPAQAIEAALAAAQLRVADCSLFEINEAFAAVAIASQRRLGIPLDIVNVNGGAIAMGHPVGMSGARVTLHLALELARRGGGYGAAALCGGGGQGNAIILKV